MKIPEMTFDEVMRVIHFSELLFDEHKVLEVVRRRDASYHDKSWMITSELWDTFSRTHECVYSVTEGPVVRAIYHVAYPYRVEAYLKWKRDNLTDHSKNDFVKPTCPIEASHATHATWTRVKQVGTTFDKYGRFVEYEAEVPAIHCSHPDCDQVYIDHVGAQAIEVVVTEAQKRSELKSL